MVSTYLASRKQPLWSVMRAERAFGGGNLRCARTLAAAHPPARYDTNITRVLGVMRLISSTPGEPAPFTR